ncbi:MAG TPA: penicillin-binding protein 2 [Rhizomicrobium sp.]|jgi:cell division protein FtsI (penicillin-binding protein 3)|nr:penicillin-binding protein 2 [Rhizomicrobium sp.]
MKQEGPTIYQRRIVIGAALCVAAFVVVGVQLVKVTLLRTSHGPVIAAHIAAARADLVDRNGELLARDLPVMDLYAKPQALSDLDGAAADLARVTGANLARLKAGFHNAKDPYVLIARQLTPDVQDKVMHLGLPGLEFEPSAKRYYPQGRATAQLLGVTDPDGNGQSGLEGGLDKPLRTTTDKPVQTSIDMRVQYILASEVEAARETFHAIKAGGVVMDVNTGEVLAMVSVPNFDPNYRHFTGDDSDKNIMAGDRYELGSVFKVLTFALAMEDHTTTPDEVFPIGNGYKIGKFTIHEAERMPATYTAREILAHSSNIGTAQIALRSGGERQREFLESLGVLSIRHTELPEYARPIFPAPGHWGTIETATIGFGHGISVAPLSYIAAAAVVVNGGRAIAPTFLKHPADARGAQILKPETSDKMRDLLRYVVTNGTGRKADIPGYEVGGKTGSAEKPRDHGVGYQAHVLVTSFFAAFPIHNPRYIVFVLLDTPHGTKETGGIALAGSTAAPLAGRVISRIAPLLGVAQIPVTVAARETP